MQKRHIAKESAEDQHPWKKSCLKEQADESEGAEPPGKRYRTTEPARVPTPGPEEQVPVQEEEEIKEPSSISDVRILHANMNGYTTHAIDVEAEIALLENEPEIVQMKQSWTKETVTRY